MSIRSGSRWALVVAVAFAVGEAAGCAGEVTRSGNSNTNWLRSCENDSACGSELRCICGACTAACAEKSCNGLGSGAECVSPTPSEFANACGTSAPAGGICSVACSANSECQAIGANLRCIGGVCAGASLLAEAGTQTLPEGSTGTPKDAGNVRPPKLDATPPWNPDSQASVCPWDVSAGDGQTCVRMDPGVAWCWGTNAFGELGNGMTNEYSPTPVKIDGALVLTVVAGYHRTCERLGVDATLKCWGANERGQLGDGTVGGDKACGGSSALDCRSTPVQVQLSDALLNTDPQSTGLALGYAHTCAITRNPDFSLSCWGSHENGQLGTGHPASSLCSGLPCETSPVPVTLLGTTAQSVSAGERHTCAWLKGDSVSCWGDDRFGQLGYVIPSCNPDGGITPCSWASPQPVAALGSTVLQLVSGRAHNCVRRYDSTVWCWGRNDLGQLGDGTTSGNDCPGLGACKATPVRVEGLPGGGIKDIAAGGDTTCANTTSGEVWCWGSNSHGKLGNGDGSATHSAVPVQVPLPPHSSVTTISVGTGDHSCVYLPDNTAWCWGSNQYGQLGDGTEQDQPRPVKVNVCK